MGEELEIRSVEWSGECGVGRAWSVEWRSGWEEFCI